MTLTIQNISKSYGTNLALNVFTLGPNGSDISTMAILVRQMFVK